MDYVVELPVTGEKEEAVERVWCLENAGPWLAHHAEYLLVADHSQAVDQYQEALGREQAALA